MAVEPAAAVPPAGAAERPLPDADEAAALAAQFGLPFADSVTDEEVDSTLVARVPIAFARQRGCLPLREQESGAIRVALADPRALDVAADPTKKAEGGIGTTIDLVGLLTFIVIGLVIAGVLIIRLRENDIAPKSNLAPPPAAAFSSQVPPQSASKVAQQIVCWGCHNPIVGARLAKMKGRF